MPVSPAAPNTATVMALFAFRDDIRVEARNVTRR